MKLSEKQKVILSWIKEVLCFMAVLITIHSCFKDPEIPIQEGALICYPVENQVSQE